MEIGNLEDFKIDVIRMMRSPWPSTFFFAYCQQSKIRQWQRPNRVSSGFYSCGGRGGDVGACQEWMRTSMHPLDFNEILDIFN